MPIVVAQKTIHQRNKSSPALSAMSQAGGLKMAAKRTAFGDLSNTVNLLRPSKDDSAISAKGDFRLKENLPPIQEKKQTTLQKPAQRPVSVIGLRSLLSNVTNNTSQNTGKQPLIENKQQTIQPPCIQTSNTRKLTTKKSTAVFKDTVSAQLPQSESTIVELQKPLPSVAPTAPIHRELPPVPTITASDDTPESRAQLHCASGEYLEISEIREAESVTSSMPITSEAAVSSASDGISIDDRGDVKVYSYAETIDYHDEPVELVETAKAFPTTRVPLAIHAPTTQTINSYPEPVRKHKLAPVSEPEEYWEEDDIAENYEEGYVTARSFKLQGDNTTGGATTVLFPKETQKAKREIALAKDLVEGSKTVEELEDEAWDTTMVAEYGDEIFQYMKDLEVLSLLYIQTFMLTLSFRSRCCPMPTIWIIKPRFNGQCVQFLWTGSSKSIIASTFFRKRYFSASIISIAFSHARLCPSGSCN